MRFGILMVLGLLFANAHQSKARGLTYTQIPEALLGEWFDAKTGDFTYAFYKDELIYHETLWHYQDIKQNGRYLVLTIQNERGSRVALKLDFGKKGLKISSSKNESGHYAREVEEGSVKHRLRRYDGNVLKNDTVYYSGYIVNHSEKDSVITVLNNNILNNYLGASQESFRIKVQPGGYFNAKIPVACPGYLQAVGPYHGFNVYVEPGTHLFEIFKPGKPAYGGDGGLLARENWIFAGNIDYLSDPLNYLDKVKGLSPAAYKVFLDQYKARQLRFLDSVNASKSISPRTYQVQQLNIEYSIAAFKCRYNDIMYKASKKLGGNYEAVKLPFSYFDFVDSLPVNDLGIIAPGYTGFIRRMKNMKDVDNDFKQPYQDPTMDSLLTVFRWTKDLATILDAEDLNFIKLLLRATPQEKDQLIQNNPSAINSYLDKYAYLSIIPQVVRFTKTFLKDSFHIERGLTADLVASSDIMLQCAGHGIQLPAEFFGKEVALFSNEVVAEKTFSLYNMTMIPQMAKEKEAAKKRKRRNMDWNYIDPEGIISNDTIANNGYTLVFINKFADLDPLVKSKMIEVFFAVYPAQAELYNPEAPKEVIFIMDPGFEGVAASANNITRFNSNWFVSHPTDYDVVTHEVMHITQAYTKVNYQPLWVTEGIADYVRYTLGRYNKEANWYWPDYKAGQNYTDAYRITARFFYWLETKRKKGIMQALDKAMREGTYDEDFWSKETGESINELWNSYKEHPSVD
ncbi:hypothetical protein COR50_14460 [Chitinophaga caeni]|uniref:Secretory protein n=1 Tax=Chitinophaga caeni TaxID=2029983 RepID=A0A291QW60_9BACT|nr:basic secretory protein-like protein [Chitinophaga caeni]ATL48269.1 hypothetical protein COR50_14460 [Chitinophaga caeni]